jgi:Flp pilus assembly protein TadG
MLIRSHRAGFGSPAKREPRLGIAVVEFAVVASLLFVLVLGIIEFGRAMMVLEMLTNAARNGCRTGTLAGSVKSDVTGAVTNALTGAGFSGTRTTVQDNGTTLANDTDSTGLTGDTVTVTVQVPYSNVTWLPTSIFLGGKTLGSSIVMRHE